MPGDVVLRDDVIDVLVQTAAWRRLFPNCMAVPTRGCSYCGSSYRTSVALSPSDRSRAKHCLMSADPTRISDLKRELGVTTLILFTNGAGGTPTRQTL
jgi:hypothetical protein